MEKHLEVERSIIKKYRREIWKRFITAVNEYKLVSPTDKIAVCVSGGKDSMLLAKCMQELQRHGDFHFGLEFLVMDPGYSPENRRRIEENARLLDIPIHIFESNIFDVVTKMDGSPCYMCARMRRGYLYKHARELGCNKIALGHHFDDVVETVLMSMLYAAQVRTMMPKLHSTNFEGMELIRPLYMVRERDILAWRRYNSLSFLNCACRLTQNDGSSMDGEDSKRAETKALIASLRKMSPNVDVHIFRSIHNVNLDTLIGYSKAGVRHSFLDEYDKSAASDEE